METRMAVNEYRINSLQTSAYIFIIFIILLIYYAFYTSKFNILFNSLDVNIGLGLSTASFILGRLDKRDTDLKMELMQNQTRADKRDSDLKMELMQNQTRADKRDSDLKMELMQNQTRADMKQMRTEALVYNGFTLFVAILAIIIPILVTKSK